VIELRDGEFVMDGNATVSFGDGRRRRRREPLLPTPGGIRTQGQGMVEMAVGDTLVDGPMTITLNHEATFTYVPPTLERTGSVSIEPLRNRHPGSVCYIVGKGPSLANLVASDFGPGPVIVINEAIRFVQALGLPNQVYSMQKDGCTTEDPDTIPRPCDTCEAFNWRREPVFDPFPGIAVLFSQHFSSWCLHGRKNRFVFTDAELGYADQPGTMSVLEAIPMARHFGSASIVMVAFDSLTDGNLQTLAHVDAEHYTLDYEATDSVEPVIAANAAVLRTNLEWVRPRVMAALADFGPHSFLQPRERA
jgi:hypothetical protein